MASIISVNWIYCMISHVSGLLEFFCAFTMAQAGVVASKAQHSSLLTTLLHVPHLFFEVRTTGQIINLFSTDMAEIDLVMPFTMRSMMNTILQAAGTVFIFCASIPLALTSLPPTVIAYFFIQVNPPFCLLVFALSKVLKKK